MAARQLTRDGVEVELQPRVFELLVALVSRWGQVVGRADLTGQVWPGVHVSDNVLDQALRKVRGALGEPSRVTAIPRRGWRFEGPVWAEAATELVGRQDWLTAAQSRLQTPGLHAWWGPAGVGKSALAAALSLGGAVTRLASPSTEVDDWLWRVALAFGVDSPDRLTRAFESRGRAALVLDGAPATLAPVARRWCEAAPTLTVAVFSREPVAGGHEVPALADADLARILAPRAGPLAHALAVHCRGIPGVAWVLRSALDLLPAEDLVRRLDAGVRVDVLADLASADLRHRSPTALALLGALVTAARPVALDELERAWPAADVVTALDSLRTAGWVAARNVHFTAASAARSADPARLQAGRTGWLGYLRRQVRAVLPAAVRMQDDAIQALQGLRGDLLAARDPEPDLAVGLAIGSRYQGPWPLALVALRAAPTTPLVQALTGEYLLRTGVVDAGAAALREAAASGDVGATALAALFLARAGGDADAAVTHARAAEAPGIEALAEEARGGAFAAEGAHQAADAAFDRAVALASAPGLRRVRGAVLQNRAVAVGRRGAHAEAVRWLTAAVADLEQVSGAAGAATTRLNLGQALVAVGRPKDAWVQLAAALPLLAAVGDEPNEALALFRGGLVRLLLGDRTGAERLAATLAARGHHPRRRADHALLEGLVALGRGREDAAEASFSVAAAICRAVGDGPGAREAERLTSVVATQSLDSAEQDVRAEFIDFLRVQRTFSAGRRTPR